MTTQETAPQTVEPRRPPRRERTTGGVLGSAGAAILVMLFAAAAAAPALTRYGPQERAGLPNRRPSAEHLLGTNDVGHDLFAQLVFGARVSLTIGLLAALFALAVGLTVALLAGYLGGTVDAALMRAVDLTLAFPFIPLVLVVAAFLGRGLFMTVFVIGAVIWAQPARVLRSQVLKVLKYEHVQAAQAMGASTLRILAVHILPRTAPLAAAQFVRSANVAIMIEASLSFLGLGDPQRISWGSMLFFANAHNAIVTEAWRWWIVPPGLALTATVVGFAFVGYSFEEWGDRRLTGGSGSVRRRRWAAEHAARGPAAPADPQVVLDIRDLHVHYDTPDGAVRAVDGISLTVGRGRLVGLVGESGCGKTTLAMALPGLIPHPGAIVGGTVVLDGHQLTAMRPGEVGRLRGRVVSLVPQSAMNALNPAYTVRRQIAEAAALTREPDDAAARADELIELVGLSAAKATAYPHELSGGMKQRVVIAMAIANEPALVVADEPLTGLDVLTQARIVRLLLELQERLDVAILLVSHDLPLVGQVVDDLLVMYAGRIVEDGPAKEVVADPRHPYTRQLLKARPQLRGADRDIAPIPGLPPDLRRPPTGCRFHPRCAEAFDDCQRVDPDEYEAKPGHCSACLLERP
ncbi:MAG TPA: dipeptide/oligopeptide/nickel ABC transporter permease/ATP-binding protein [Egibacteraceae bacterium]|jgi:peptide/nickel transport system permease protein|nr:dipeptide/oligopeptide/nickel ABC transporter permease/ATP-binding protein [Egibacteraceae bacterium]